MNPRVIGLDLSIAATGYADNHGGEIRTTTFHTDPKDYDKNAAGTRKRLTTITTGITSGIGDGPTPVLVVVEGPSYGSKGNALHQLAGLWWLIYDALTRAELPVAVVPPGVLKKYATGKGTADKTAMAVALQKRADIELGDDNRVDAWWLVAAGLEHLEYPVVSLPAPQRAVLAGITWPEVSI